MWLWVSYLTSLDPGIINPACALNGLCEVEGGNILDTENCILKRMVLHEHFLLNVNQSTTEAALIIIKGFEETSRKYAKCSFTKAREYNNVLITHYRKIYGKCSWASFGLSFFAGFYKLISTPAKAETHEVVRADPGIVSRETLGLSPTT